MALFVGHHIFKSRYYCIKNAFNQKRTVMKPMLEHLEPAHQETFFAGAFDYPYFGTPWHYHPEYELVLVIRSRGKRFIGNAVSEFREGDLTFLGPNLPHLYRNPAPYYQEGSLLRAQSIVIHFQKSSLGCDLLALPQLRGVRRLFELSRQGMDFHGPVKYEVTARMRRMLEISGLKRLIMLLEILELLAETPAFELISGPGIVGHNAFESERLNAIFQYILQHFDQSIKLENVASRVHMTRSSFCRFFKDHTKKSFSDFLIDVRLGHATKLLVEGTESVTQVAFKCGYNNLSNFNRQFKRKFDVTPKQYREANYLRV